METYRCDPPTATSHKEDGDDADGGNIEGNLSVTISSEGTDTDAEDDVLAQPPAEGAVGSGAAATRACRGRSPQSLAS
jgi:hypothetical protein